MGFIEKAKKMSIGTMIVTFLLGIIFTAFPEECIKYISIVIGASMIAFGVIGVIIFLMSERFLFTLITSIITICAGVIICTSYFEIISVIVAIIGAVFIFIGLFNLIAAIRVIAGSLVFGWVTLLLSIICMVFGVIAFTHSQETTIEVFRFIGVAFIFSTVLEIISYFQVRKLYKTVKSAVDEATGNEIETSATVIEDEDE